MTTNSNSPADVRLSPHFLLSEFSVSASHPELVEPVPDALLPAVRRLVTTILEPVRGAWGKSLTVQSGYRSEKLNAAVNGSPTSQHRYAEAADLTTDGVRDLFVKLLTRHYEVPCGQVIYYPKQNFIHVALPGTHYPTPCFFVSRTAKKYEVVSSVDALVAKGL